MDEMLPLLLWAVCYWKLEICILACCWTCWAY